MLLLLVLLLLLLLVLLLCLVQRKKYSSQLESMLVAHVFPEFRSSLGYMRARVSAIVTCGGGGGGGGVGLVDGGVIQLP